MQLEALAGDLLVGGQDAFGLHVQADRWCACALEACTMPETISPIWRAKYSICAERSASRMRCWITWRAVCAATRPKSEGVDSTMTMSPSWASGFTLRASSRVTSVFVLLDLLDDFLFGENRNFAGLGIDLGFDLLGRGGVDRPAIGRNHGGFDRSKDDLLGKLLFFQDFVEGQGEFVLGHATYSI